MAYLDGKRIDVKILDPSKHKLVGKFRPPSYEDMFKKWKEEVPDFEVVVCPCGSHLWTMEQGYEHWEKGCFDELLYETYRGATG